MNDVNGTMKRLQDNSPSAISLRFEIDRLCREFERKAGAKPVSPEFLCAFVETAREDLRPQLFVELALANWERQATQPATANLEFFDSGCFRAAPCRKNRCPAA